MIRPATAADLAELEGIENAADRLFIERFKPAYWAPAPTPDQRPEGGVILVLVEGGGQLDAVSHAESPSIASSSSLDDRSTSTSTPHVIGFIHVLFPTTTHAHIEALAVRPEHARRGHGAALVRAGVALAAERGCDWVTLRTYANVPWNQPFYERCGFKVWTVGAAGMSGEGLRGSEDGRGEEWKTWVEFNDRCVRAEEGLGLMEYGERVVMGQRVGGGR